MVGLPGGLGASQLWEQSGAGGSSQSVNRTGLQRAHLCSSEGCWVLIEVRTRVLADGRWPVCLVGGSASWLVSCMRHAT
jgi:hypothetical protein